MVMQLLNIAPECPQALWKLLQKPWMRDGLSPFEVDAIFRLESIVRIDAAANRVVGMPLVDLGTGAVEKRFLRLPRAGEATLSVLNVSPGDYSTLDMLERLVHALEELMGVH